MSTRDEGAARVGSLLGIRYTHALRLVREARRDLGDDVPFTDLALACRGLKEAEEERRRYRRSGALPKGAGAVRCGDCDAEARADGKGTPIVLKHDDGCPEKYPIKDHRYDAGYPRDDSRGCIAVLLTRDGTEEWHEECGQPLSAHAQSEYPEDGR